MLADAASEINSKDGQEESKCFRNTIFTRPQCTKLLSTMLQLRLADKTLSYTHNLFYMVDCQWQKGGFFKVLMSMLLDNLTDRLYMDISFYYTMYWLFLLSLGFKKHVSSLGSMLWLEEYLVFMGLIVPRKHSLPHYPINLNNLWCWYNAWQIHGVEITFLIICMFCRICKTSKDISNLQL